MHIGCGDGNVAQRRSLECPDVIESVADGEAAELRCLGVGQHFDISQFTGFLLMLLKQVIKGRAQCVIAAGSEPVELPFIPHDDERVIDSTGALALEDVPGRMLVIGGGIIGCSIAYHLGHLGWSDVVVVERHELTSGTTWHAAGLMTTFGSTSETSVRRSRPLP